MRSALERIRHSALADLDKCEDSPALEDIRVRVLGRKGELTAVLRGMREVAESERPAMGELANTIKAEIEERIAGIRARLEQQRLAKSLAEERIDVTLPGVRLPYGHVHPLTQVLDEIVGVFVEMGFGVEEGPEIEDDYHNFEALNIPARSPCARHAGHLLRHRRSRAAHAHLARADSRDGVAPAAAARDRAGCRVPPRRRRHDAFADLPPGGGLSGRRGDHVRRSQGGALRVLAALLRGRNARALSAELLPVHRAVAPKSTSVA